MGVPGLLPYVSKACCKGNVTLFEGKTIAVDVSCLLHRGGYGCAEKIAKGQQTDFYIHYIKKQLAILFKLNCRVILIFDGQPLPAKECTHEARKIQREKNLVLANRLMQQGQIVDANRAFGASFTITNDIIKKTIQAFRNEKNVDIIVSPYESDAQLAFLMQSGLADIVITEDTDLIVYGCETILFKFESTGNCLIFQKKNLKNCLLPSFSKRFNHTIFRRMCILAGCDYLRNGVNGIGLKKAEDFFFRTSKTDLRELLPKIPFYLNMPSLKISKEIVENFIKAENTFIHQIVFDPIKLEQRPLNPYPEGSSTNFSYAGTISSPSDAVRMALGNTDMSLPPNEDMFVLSSEIPSSSVWNRKHLEFIKENRKIHHNKENVEFAELRRRTNQFSREDTVSEKKTRFSLEESSNSSITKNGVTQKWTADDWLREYSSFKYDFTRDEQSSTRFSRKNDATNSCKYLSKSPNMFLKNESLSSPVIKNSLSPGKKIPPSLQPSNTLSGSRCSFPSVMQILTSVPTRSPLFQNNDQQISLIHPNASLNKSKISVDAKVLPDKNTNLSFKTALNFEFSVYKPIELSSTRN